jgi:hypothetical protein
MRRSVLPVPIYFYTFIFLPSLMLMVKGGFLFGHVSRALRDEPIEAANLILPIAHRPFSA